MTNENKQKTFVVPNLIPRFGTIKILNGRIKNL